MGLSVYCFHFLQSYHLKGLIEPFDNSFFFSTKFVHLSFKRFFSTKSWSMSFVRFVRSSMVSSRSSVSAVNSLYKSLTFPVHRVIILISSIFFQIRLELELLLFQGAIFLLAFHRDFFQDFALLLKSFDISQQSNYFILKALLMLCHLKAEVFSISFLSSFWRNSKTSCLVLISWPRSPFFWPTTGFYSSQKGARSFCPSQLSPSWSLSSPQTFFLKLEKFTLLSCVYGYQYMKIYVCLFFYPSVVI